jgi:hypothetical protein
MNNESIQQKQYKGYTINIELDRDPASPREWDNLGTMACSHNNYILGDTQLPDHYMDDYGYAHYFESWKDVEKWLRKDNDIAIILPLQLYDHSGITMSIGSSRGWDSGQVGFIYVTKETLRKEYSIKRVTKAILEKAEQVLRAEVDAYDQYLRGDVYGYAIDTDNDTGWVGDSCWGYFGDSGIEQAFSDAENSIDYRLKELAREREQKTKKNIKAGVPILYRQ